MKNAFFFVMMQNFKTPPELCDNSKCLEPAEYEERSFLDKFYIRKYCVKCKVKEETPKPVVMKTINYIRLAETK